MSASVKEKLIEILKDQKEIFGNELFEEKLSRKTKIEAVNKNVIETGNPMPEKKSNSSTKWNL